MSKYNKEKQLLLTLTKLTKTELKSFAIKERRSLNNLINIALENYIEGLEK